MAYKVIIWGDKEQYDRFISPIMYEVLKGNIEITAIVSDDGNWADTIDGYPVIQKRKASGMSFDYVIATGVDFHLPVVRGEVMSLGIDGEKVISAKVFLMPMFDFYLYAGLLQNKISIVSNNCWGGVIVQFLILRLLFPVYQSDNRAGRLYQAAAAL